MAIKYSNVFHSKALQNIKIHPNWDFWYEKFSSGNPDFDELTSRVTRGV
jgi:hypothetical protein